MTKVYPLITNIKNAHLARKTIIFQKKNKLCSILLDILWDEGLILGYRITKICKYYFEIFLKYCFKNPYTNLSGIRILNRFNNRIFLSLKQLWKINSTTNTLILATSQGILTQNDCRKYKIGGKPILITN